MAERERAVEMATATKRFDINSKDDIPYDNMHDLPLKF